MLSSLPPDFSLPAICPTGSAGLGASLVGIDEDFLRLCDEDVLSLLHSALYNIAFQHVL